MARPPRQPPPPPEGPANDGRNPPPILSLGDLTTASPNLSATVGAHHAEAAAVCLDHCDHSSPVTMAVDGPDVPRSASVTFGAVTEAMRRTHADLEEATEFGACGVAILLVKAMLGQLVVERSRRGTGFDYWIGPPGGALLQAKARLEVSGLLLGTRAQVAARVREKREQTKQSDGLRLPAYVVVIEFSGPRAVVEKR